MATRLLRSLSFFLSPQLRSRLPVRRCAFFHFPAAARLSFSFATLLDYSGEHFGWRAVFYLLCEDTHHQHSLSSGGALEWRRSAVDPSELHFAGDAENNDILGDGSQSMSAARRRRRQRQHIDSHAGAHRARLRLTTANEFIYIRTAKEARRRSGRAHRRTERAAVNGAPENAAAKLCAINCIVQTITLIADFLLAKHMLRSGPLRRRDSDNREGPINGGKAERKNGTEMSRKRRANGGLCTRFCCSHTDRIIWLQQPLTRYILSFLLCISCNTIVSAVSVTRNTKNTAAHSLDGGAARAELKQKKEII